MSTSDSANRNGQNNQPGQQQQERQQKSPPSIDRSLTLNFIGDWGQANFHRICSWLTQEFCDRCGPRSRVGIWNVRGGGIEAVEAVHDGEVQLSVATPAGLLRSALMGKGMFTRAMPQLRALAVLPQNDRMVLAIDPKFGVKTFEELRQKKPALRIATSTDDGTNFIGHVASKYMQAHGVSEETLESWGGSYVRRHRPEQSLIPAQAGGVDAVLQEAIMTPWWSGLIEGGRKLVPLAAEPDALEQLEQGLGLGTNVLPAGFWNGLESDLPALDFSDFVILVRDDLPDDVAYLLTWCLVETRAAIERQYHHIPAHRSPLSYPMVPEKMAKTPIPLHPAARRYYEDAGHL